MTAAALSIWGLPRSGSKAASTASSMLLRSSVLREAMSGGEGRARGLEGAVVAQGADVGPEVLGITGPRDRGPDRGGPSALAADGLLGGRARNGNGLAQVQEPHLGRRLPQGALTQQGVGLHADQAATLVALRRRPPGLVVDDHEAAVRGQVEAVDLAAQAHTFDVHLD